jgi:hypothetical protein
VFRGNLRLDALLQWEGDRRFRGIANFRVMNAEIHRLRPIGAIFKTPMFQNDIFPRNHTAVSRDLLDFHT